MTVSYVQRYLHDRHSGRDPEAVDPPVMGYCDNVKCNCELRADYDYFEDYHGFKFCSEECAFEFYKKLRNLREKEWDLDEYQ